MGIDIAKADEIIDLIYQGPLEKSPWQSFLRALRVHLDCDVAAMSLRIRRDEMPAIYIWDHRRPPLDPEVLRSGTRNMQLYGHLDPLTKVLTKPGDLYTLDEVISRAELVATDYYKFVMVPFDIEHQMGMHIAEPGGWRSNVGVLNGRGAGNFRRTAKAFLASLRPHLERALQLHARIKNKELESEAFEKALDRLTIAVYVLDADGRVIDVNGLGRKFADQKDGFLISGNRLTLGKASENARLSEAIKRALVAREAGQAEGFVAAMAVSRKHGASLSMLVRAVDTTEGGRDYASPSVVVYVCDHTLSRTAPDRFVAEIFGLTPTEARTATLLASGMTLAQIAKKLGVGENTVRSYAKRTFGKAGVSRQAELVRLILNSVAPLA